MSRLIERRPRRLRLLAYAAISCLLVAVPCTSSHADVSVGVLHCEVAGGLGYVLGSSRTIQCSYEPHTGTIEYYYGSMSTIGADIGYLAKSNIVWAVIAPASTGNGALAGTYVGASIRAAIVGGAGVNALVGGFQNSIALQPLSVEGNSGLYLGGGLGIMNLKAGDPGY